MKTFRKFFTYAAVAAFAFSSCTPEKLKNDNLNEGKTVTVHFGAETTDPSSKATLTPNDGETAFQAAWENNDMINVSYTYVDAGITKTTFGTWDSSASKFSADITDLTIGEEVLAMKYQSSFPYSDNSYVDFGSARTQTGATYNSVYDLMIADAVTVTAKPGLDESGKAIVFPMQRQTAIAYFHFTSNNKELITKAKLKVEGEGAAIAAKTLRLEPTGMDYETGLSEIELTTTGQTADDFTLWFNVLPTSYTSMTLTVETATKTFTISKSTKGEYVKGKLYKVKKEGISWKTKPTTIFFYESFDKCEKTGGNDDTWSNISTNGPIVADNTGWSFTKGNQASKCARFGTGNDEGSATTPSLGISTSEATLWFKAGAWDHKDETTELNLSISGNGSITPNSITLTKGAWTEYYCTISGAAENTKVIFSAGNTTNNRFFLDEVYVYSGPKPSKYSVNIASVEGGGGSLVASPTSAIEGTEITLTATPDDGYAFNNNWIVTNAETSEIITVNDGKFNMPAANVTVSASFTPTGAGAGEKKATLDITSTVTESNIKLKDDKDNSWLFTTDGSLTGNTAYIQAGTGTKSVTYVKLVSTGLSSKTIKKIQLWGTSKANSNVSPKVIIGNTTIGTGSVYTTQNASSGGTEFSVENTNNVVGEVTLEISRPSSAKGAIYFNKAIITYVE